MIPPNKEQLFKDLMQCCLLEGDFVLRSGQRSQVYFDKYAFESQPRLLREVARLMTQHVPRSTQVLAGLELGGVPLATAISLHSGLPVAFVRKQAKGYGSCRLAEGLDIKNKTLCLVEDVVTTGGQVLKSIAALESLGATVGGVVCVLDRYHGALDRHPLAQWGFKSLWKLE